MEECIMLEIPECSTITTQINQTLKGKHIKDAIAGSSPHGFAFYFGDPADYSELLTGETIHDTVSLSSFVEIELNKAKLLLSEGVNITYFEPGVVLPKKHQLCLTFEDDSHLVCTLQMYGCMMAFHPGEYENPYYLVAQEKPSPLTDEFNQNYFEQLIHLSKPTLSAKAFLATQQRIPGLGNGVLHDILFHARIHPKRKLNTFSSQDFDRLYISVKDTLSEMTMKGGRDTERDLFGCKGGYQTILSSKTLAEPCPVCGGFITKQTYLGGSIYYCPVCQHL